MVIKSNWMIPFIVSVVLSGCGTITSDKEDIIPKSDMTTEEVYDKHTANKMFSIKHKVTMRDATERELLRNPYKMNNSSRPVFDKLPNPTLYMYFPATISKDGRMPIPAWMTEIPMYDRDEYAKRGEVSLKGAE